MLFDIANLVIAAPLRASDVVVRLGRLSGLALLGLLGLLVSNVRINWRVAEIVVLHSTTVVHAWRHC